MWPLKRMIRISISVSVYNMREWIWTNQARPLSARVNPRVQVPDFGIVQVLPSPTKSMKVAQSTCVIELSYVDVVFRIPLRTIMHDAVLFDITYTGPDTTVRGLCRPRT